jgi:hypothetical protein
MTYGEPHVDGWEEWKACPHCRRAFHPATFGLFKPLTIDQARQMRRHGCVICCKEGEAI